MDKVIVVGGAAAFGIGVLLANLFARINLNGRRNGPRARKATNENVAFRKSRWMLAPALNGHVQKGDNVDFLRIYYLADFPRFFCACFSTDEDYQMPTMANYEERDLATTFSYIHTAICVGKDHQGKALVVGFNDLQNPAPGGGNRALRVCQQRLDAVAAGRHSRVNNEFDKKWIPLENEEIVQFALGARLTGKIYKLLTYNCQHFCNHCRYDVIHSAQADIFLGFFDRLSPFCKALISLRNAGLRELQANFIELFGSFASLLNCYNLYKFTRLDNGDEYDEHVDDDEGVELMGFDEQAVQLRLEAERALALIDTGRAQRTLMDYQQMREYVRQQVRQQMRQRDQQIDVQQMFQEMLNVLIASGRPVRVRGTIHLDTSDALVTPVDVDIQVALEQFKPIRGALHDMLNALPQPVHRPALQGPHREEGNGKR